MIRLLLLALLIFLAYTLYLAVIRSMPGRGSRTPPSSSPRGEEMVRDPHCGTYVPKSAAIRKTIGGEVRHFCSKECREAFARRK